MPLGLTTGPDPHPVTHGLSTRIEKRINAVTMTAGLDFP